MDTDVRNFGYPSLTTATSLKSQILSLLKPGHWIGIYSNQKDIESEYLRTKIQTTKLSILPRFYFHDVLEQLKTSFHTNFASKEFLVL